MKLLICIALLLFCSFNLFGQAEIRVGDPFNHTNLVMDNGTLVVGSLNDSIAGAIKFENGNFFGFDGQDWLPLTGGAPEKEIIGLSTMTTNGRMQLNGKFGIEAATEMCKVSYPNEPTARYYFQHDIDEALAAGNIPNVTQGEWFWSFKHGFTGFTNAFESRHNNCWCFAFNSGDYADGTKGQIFTTVPSPGNGGQIISNQVNYQKGILCSTQYRVICGK